MNCRVFSRLIRTEFYVLGVTRRAQMATSDTSDKKPVFGKRFLTDPQNVFEHNAWDNVVWDEQQEKEAQKKTEEQLAHPATEEEKEKYLKEASEYWDQFYQFHDNKFFKDRQWLFTEFPELAPEFYLSQEEISKFNSLKLGENTDTSAGICSDNSTGKDKHTEVTSTMSDNVNSDSDKDKPDASECDNEAVSNSDSSQSNNKDTVCDKTREERLESFPGESKNYRIFEVGCGAGNTVFPILQTNNDPDLMVYCCDFSPVAVDIVKENKDYVNDRCHAFVCDVSDPDATIPMPEASLDVIVMIFVFSAIPPERMQSTLNRLAKLLKPGGVLLLRDYGRYDMAQLRFKKGRCLSENFYARGHGTLVYFFTQEELREMMTKAGLLEKQNYVDRRLQVNRGRQLKMYRVWIQCKYVKPKEEAESSVNQLEPV